MNIYEIYNKHQKDLKKKIYNIDGYTLNIDEDYKIDEISKHI